MRSAAEMNVPIPAARQTDAVALAALEPDAVGRGIPFARGMSAASPDPVTPDGSLHIRYAEQVTAAVSYILDTHARRQSDS